jgi:uncharacterized protein
MLSDQIVSDLTASMKAKETVKMNTLRMLKSAIKNKEIEKKEKSLTDAAILEIIQKQVKQRNDSIEEFKKAKRQDLVDKEEQELAVLQAYLPEQLSQDALKAIVAKAIETTGAKGKADMGQVMKAVMAETKGRADGKSISQLVSSALK